MKWIQRSARSGCGCPLWCRRITMASSPKNKWEEPFSREKRWKVMVISGRYSGRKRYWLPITMCLPRDHWACTDSQLWGFKQEKMCTVKTLSYEFKEDKFDASKYGKSITVFSQHGYNKIHVTDNYHRYCWNYKVREPSVMFHTVSFVKTVDHQI